MSQQYFWFFLAQNGCSRLRKLLFQVWVLGGELSRSWGDFVKGLEFCCQNTVPCASSRWRRRKRRSLSGKVLASRWTKRTNLPGRNPRVWLCWQMALGCVRSAVVFPRCRGWDNHGQRGAALRNGERQCGEIRAAGTRSRVALGGRHAGFGATCECLALLILAMWSVRNRRDLEMPRLRWPVQNRTKRTGCSCSICFYLGY